MRDIKQIKKIKGKKALVRVDLNVPIKDGKVLDDFRIRKTIPTIEFLSKAGAKVILISHLGKGGETLEPVAEAMNKFVKVRFVSSLLGEKTKEVIDNMKNGDIVLLENLRNDKGEKDCDKIFALNLAKLVDPNLLGVDAVYVNEAFSVSHREDASLVLLPKFLPAYCGLQLLEEIKNLSHVFKKAKHPFLFIVGGAKFSTKMPLIEKYLKLADYVFIGGALSGDILRAEGYEVGRSLVDNENYNILKIVKNKKLILPEDVIVDTGEKLILRKVDEIEKNETIIDIGDETAKKLTALIKKSKLILWNGPLGKYEAGGGGATKQILKLVAVSKAESIIGGGDTVALISEMKMENKFSFVSTGGGATLDFLANGTLPGIKAL